MLQARVLGTVLLLAGLCLPAAVRGEEPPLKSELARRHYELGEQQFKRARYAPALEEFRKARQLDARPALLFNIGRCLEYLGQLAEARDHYRRYLIEEPDSPHREMVQRRIKSIEFELSRKQAASSASPAPAPEKPGRARESGTWRGTAGWITLGVGGAALVTGAVFGGLVQSKTKSYEDAWARGETYSELESIARDGERYETAQWATLIAGGVLAAGGVALLLWHYLGRDRRQDAASLRLLPGPGLGAAVGLEL